MEVKIEKMCPTSSADRDNSVPERSRKIRREGQNEVEMVKEEKMNDFYPVNRNNIKKDESVVG